MADITKCSGEGCPLKKTCWRHTAPDSFHQSYFMTPPIKDGECKMYWPDEDYSKYYAKEQNKLNNE